MRSPLRVAIVGAGADSARTAVSDIFARSFDAIDACGSIEDAVLRPGDYALAGSDGSGPRAAALLVIPLPDDEATSTLARALEAHAVGLSRAIEGVTANAHLAGPAASPALLVTFEGDPTALESGRAAWTTRLRALVTSPLDATRARAFAELGRARTARSLSTVDARLERTLEGSVPAAPVSVEASRVGPWLARALDPARWSTAVPIRRTGP